MRPRPKSVVLDLLSSLPQRSAPVRLLVAATAIFGIDSNATRVAITRLLAAGLIERDERGAYRTGSAAVPILERLTNWRSMESRTRSWDGSWLAAAPDAGEPNKDTRALSVRALEFSGLREFSPGLWVRPNNLALGLEPKRRSLRALGMGPSCPVFTLHDFDEATEARARSLWESEDIPGSYRRLTAELLRSGASLDTLPEKEAMAESFLLGGEAIRCLVLDPLLPDAIVSTAARDELLQTMLAYDRLGRRAWARFLEGYGVGLGEHPLGEHAGDAQRDLGSDDVARMG